MASTIRVTSAVSLSVGVRILNFVGVGVLTGLPVLINQSPAIMAASISFEPRTVLGQTTTYEPPDNGGPDSTQGSGTR